MRAIDEDQSPNPITMSVAMKSDSCSYKAIFQGMQQRLLCTSYLVLFGEKVVVVTKEHMKWPHIRLSVTPSLQHKLFVSAAPAEALSVRFSWDCNLCNDLLCHCSAPLGLLHMDVIIY